MIEDKRKRLHYESIRIEEIKKEVKLAKDRVTHRLHEIEELVKEDTRDIHSDKEVVDGKITEVEKEIEELEKLLEAKRQQRESLLLER